MGPGNMVSGYRAEWAEGRQDRIGREGKAERRKRDADRGLVACWVARWAWQLRCPLVTVFDTVCCVCTSIPLEAAWQSRHYSNRCSGDPLNHTPSRRRDNGILPNVIWPALQPGLPAHHRSGGLRWPLR